MKTRFLTTKRLVFIAFYAAIIHVLQIALAPFPNIEVVSFLLILGALFLNKKTILFITMVFILLQGVYWGFGEWWFFYCYVWPLYIFVVILFKKILKSPVSAAFMSGFVGISFGLMYCILQFFLYGFNKAIANYIIGIPFDVIHCLSNFIIMILLYEIVKPIIININLRLEGDKNE